MQDDLAAIKKYWDNQAKQNQGSSLATSPDTIAYEMELDQMKSWISEGSTVLDVGCGNGIKGIELSKAMNITYVGVDYSEEMINQAKQMELEYKGVLKGNVQFFVGNILESNSLPSGQFDIVMTDRCLINLQTIDNQIAAVCNLQCLLSAQGKFLMFENSLQALENLNKVRRGFGLEDIAVRWHNIYIDEKVLFTAISPYFKLLETISFASTYSLISRTLNALLTPPGQLVDYNSEINKLAAKLPPLGDFSPVKLFVLEKIC